MATFEGLQCVAVSNALEYRKYKDGRLDPQTGLPATYAAYDVTVRFGQHAGGYDEITGQQNFFNDDVTKTFIGDAAQAMSQRGLKPGIMVKVAFSVIPRKSKEGSVVFGYDLNITNVMPM